MEECVTYENYSNDVTLSFLAAIAIALVVVVRNAAASERQFTVIVFPPTICEDDGRTVFNALLPPSLTAVFICIVLSVICLVIHKVRPKYPNIHTAISKTV